MTPEPRTADPRRLPRPPPAPVPPPLPADRPEPVPQRYGDISIPTRHIRRGAVRARRPHAGRRLAQKTGDARRGEEDAHARIGYVNKLDDGSYRGTLRTLSISAALKIMPNKEKKPDSDQPDFRVYANGAEIGGAWIRQGKETGADYVSISISAPEFGPRRRSPISAAQRARRATTSSR